MLIVLVILIAILSGGPVCGAGEAPAVTFVPGDVSASAVRDAKDLWQRLSPGVVARLWPAGRPVRPIVVELLGTEEFQTRTGGAVGDWSVGIATDNWIAVDVDRVRAVGHTLSHVMIHELAHCLLAQAMPQVRGVPRWFHEGVAQHVAGEWHVRDTVSLILDGGALRLAELDRRFPRDRSQVDRAYRTSLLAVRQLEKRYGQDVLRNLIATAVMTGSFPEAFTVVTGEGLSAFVAGFTADSGLRYGWLLMLARWPTLFVMITLLFLVGAVVKVRRDRRRLAEMPDGPFIEADESEALRGELDHESENRYRN